MKHNKFGSNVLTQNKQQILSDKLKQLKSKQTHSKTRNNKVINKLGRFIEEYRRDRGLESREFLILNFYDKVWVENGVESKVMKCADVLIFKDEIRTVRQDILELV